MEARSPLTFGAVGDPGLASLSQPAPVQKESGASTFLDKYLRPPSVNPLHPDSISTSGLLVRTYSAASRVFFLRDDTGKVRLNTSYFLGILSTAALHTASRPYWAQSASGTFNDFGSSVGSDAGLNVFHEFEPGIRQMVKGRIPKIVSKIQQRVAHGHITGDAPLPSR